MIYYPTIIIDRTFDGYHSISNATNSHDTSAARTISSNLKDNTIARLSENPFPHLVVLLKWITANRGQWQFCLFLVLASIHLIPSCHSEVDILRKIIPYCFLLSLLSLLSLHALLHQYFPLYTRSGFPLNRFQQCPQTSCPHQPPRCLSLHQSSIGTCHCPGVGRKRLFPRSVALSFLKLSCRCSSEPLSYF